MNTQATPPDPPAAGESPDPSMEDILASIRRILSEDETAGPAAKPTAPPESEVLTLDPSMLVEEPRPAGSPAVAPDKAAPPLAEAERAAEVPHGDPSPTPAPSTLVAPEAAAAAASSVGELLRAVAAGRQQVAVHHGGPTIEDLVREEIRPLLKEWLDTNLAPLVERLVRAEIERVVGRALS